MPRFFFNVRRSGSLERDPVGVDFPSLEEAHDDAVRFVKEMLTERIMGDAEIDEEGIVITDGDGVALSEVLCRSIIHIK